MNIQVVFELGRFAITLRTACLVIAVWFHIVESIHNTHLKQVCASMLQQVVEKASWIQFIESIINNTRLGHVCNNHSTLNVKVTSVCYIDAARK